MNEVIKPQMVFTKDLNTVNDKIDITIATVDDRNIDHEAIDNYNQRNFKPCRHVRKNGEFVGVFCNIDSIWIDRSENKEQVKLVARIEPYHFMPAMFSQVIKSNSMLIFACETLSVDGVIKNITNIEVVTP